MNTENNSQTFEQLQNLLQSYDERLRHIAAVQEESIKRTLRNSMHTNHRSLLNWERFGIVFNLAFVVFLVPNYNKVIYDWRYFVPYLIIVLCFVGNAILSYINAKKIKEFTPLQKNLTDTILLCERYMLFYKREFIVNTTIGILICILAFPAVASKIKGWDYYQYDLLQMPFHLTVLVIAIVVGFGLDIWYYLRNRRTLQQLKDNISEYKELNDE